MKYVVKLLGDDGANYYLGPSGKTEQISNVYAAHYDSKASAMRAMLGTPLSRWAENARIVRLKPKAKPAMIPVPVIEASNGYLMVNRNTVFYMPPSVLNVDAVAKNLRRALGLPEQPCPST